MDFAFTPEQSAFRDELREFLSAEVPSEKQQIFGVSSDDLQLGREIKRKLATRKWVAIGLSEEDSGRGKGPIEQGILDEELGYHRVPESEAVMDSPNHDKTGLRRYGAARRVFDDFTDFCNDSAPDGGQPLAEHPLVRHQLAQRRLGMETWKLLCRNVAWIQSVGTDPVAEASAALLFGVEERLRFSEMAMEVLGPYATLRNGSPMAPMLGNIEGIHREALHLSETGSTDTHRDIISQSGLGL